MPRLFPRWCAASLAICLLNALGCIPENKSTPSSAEARRAERREKLAERAAKNAGPIRFEECEEFVYQMNSALDARDAAAINDMIDWGALYDEITEGWPGAEKHRGGFVRQYVTQQFWGKAIIGLSEQALAQGEDYEFLRIHGTSDDVGVWYRVSGPTGVVYHDYRLARGADGRVVACNVYTSSAGEYFSDTIRPLILPLLEHESRGFLERLSGQQNAYIKHLPSISKMNEVVGTNPRLALSIYKSLPQELQSMKTLLLFRVMCSQHVSQEEHVAAIHEFVRRFGNDGSSDMLLFNAHCANEDWDEALKCVDRIENHVGGDSYLPTLRCTVLLAMGRFEQARKQAELAIAQAPLHVRGYYSAVEVALAQKDFGRVVEVFEVLEERFGTTFNNLSEVPVYAEFVQSPEYTDWMLRHEEVAQYEPWPRQTQVK